MNSSRATSLDPRPTLPRLPSLDLPFPKPPQGKSGDTIISPTTPAYDSCESVSIADTFPRLPKARHVSTASSSSTSSTINSTSRTPSPTPSDTSLSSVSSTRSKGGFRLVPCPMEQADAVILTTEPTEGSSGGKALLFVGAAAQPYRQLGARQNTKGARVHPYKIMPSQSSSRRASTASIKSQIR